MYVFCLLKLIFRRKLENGRDRQFPDEEGLRVAASSKYVRTLLIEPALALILPYPGLPWLMGGRVLLSIHTTLTHPPPSSSNQLSSPVRHCFFQPPVSFRLFFFCVSLFLFPHCLLPSSSYIYQVQNTRLSLSLFDGLINHSISTYPHHIEMIQDLFRMITSTTSSPIINETTTSQRQGSSQNSTKPVASTGFKYNFDLSFLGEVINLSLVKEKET